MTLGDTSKEAVIAESDVGKEWENVATFGRLVASIKL